MKAWSTGAAKRGLPGIRSLLREDPAVTLDDHTDTKLWGRRAPGNRNMDRGRSNMKTTARSNLRKIFLLGGVTAFLVAAPALTQEAARYLTVSGVAVTVQGYGLTIVTDRVDATYLPGEAVRLFVNSARQARAVVLATDPQGRTTVVAPNTYEPVVTLHPGQAQMLPSEGASWRLGVTPPLGVVRLTVLATTGMDDPLAALGLDPRSPNWPQVPDDAVARTRAIAAVPTAAAQGIWSVAEIDIRIVAARPNAAISASAAIPVAAQPAVEVATGLGLSMFLDQPDYQIGDRMNVDVTAAQDCQLTLINVDIVSNAATVLYPNALVSKVVLTAGATMRLPDPNGKIALTVAGPAGPQRLIALCDPSPERTRAVLPTLDLTNWQALISQPGIANAVQSYMVVN